MFRSDDLPVGERLPAAHELFGRGVLPMRLEARPGTGFGAAVRHVDLAPLRVMEMAVTPATVLRTPRLIRRGDPQMLSVILPLGGSLVVSQAGRETEVGQHQIALYDSSRPFQLGFSAHDGLAQVVSAHAPRALLELPLNGLDRLLARPLSAHAGSGFGGLLAHLLTGATRHDATWRPSDPARLGGIAHDLMTALLAHHLDAETALPDDTHRTTLLLRVDAYIKRHLHDPGLTPTAVAAAHHISVSHLHRLFAHRDTTVAAWIRRQRLERARRDLSDPAMRQIPVHRIAARWGFTAHASFTRAFQAAYGTSPSHYRRAAPTDGRPNEARVGGGSKKRG